MSGLDSQSRSELVPIASAWGKYFSCASLRQDDNFVNSLCNVGVNVAGLDALCRAAKCELDILLCNNAGTGSEDEKDIVKCQIRVDVTKEENLSIIVDKLNRMINEMTIECLAEYNPLTFWLAIVSMILVANLETWHLALVLYITYNLFCYYQEKKSGEMTYVFPINFLRFMYVRARVGKVIDFIEEPEE